MNSWEWMGTNCIYPRSNQLSTCCRQLEQLFVAKSSKAGAVSSAPTNALDEWDCGMQAKHGG